MGDAMDSTSQLARDFAQRLRDVISESTQLGYTPANFEKMLDEQGAVNLAKKLVKSGEIQTGLKAVANLKRKDLAVESIMIESKFKSLFSDDELKAAAWRLEQV
jgi:hypothetical protein